jgi:hypothetical protein
MKDTDEPLTPPNTGPLTKDGMRPFIAGTADEIVPFALSLILEGESPEDARIRLLKIGSEEEVALFAKGPASPEALRAAIYRMTAASIALLALDERVRGEEVVAWEMARLDELHSSARPGFLPKRGE